MNKIKKMRDKKAGKRLFDYLDWFASLNADQKKQEIKKMDEEDRSIEGKNVTFTQFIEESRKILSENDPKAAP